MGIKILASGSAGNCYLLETQNETLILECGISFKDIKKGLNFDLSKVVGCLVTHEHKDHCKAINDVMKAGIEVYMSKGTAEGIGLKDNPYSYRVNNIKNCYYGKVGKFTVMPFDVQHDVNEPLGFIIYHKELGKTVFITDSYYCKYTFKNADHLLIECNYSESILDEIPTFKGRVLKSHMSLETLKETLKTWDLTNTKDITLIHISETNGESKRFQKEIQELTGIKTYIAEPGLEI